MSRPPPGTSIDREPLHLDQGTRRGGPPPDPTGSPRPPSMSLPKVVLTAGDDDYASVPGTAHEIFALAGNDTVHGSGTSSIGDVIWGGAGDDTLYGARYSVLDGGSGNDRLVGTSGCRLLGGIGNDELQSSGSTQFLEGGNGNDIVTADGGHVEARGGAGNDRLDLSGSEVIADSGSGSDVLRCEIVHPFGTGSLSGGDGADRIRFDGANEAWWDMTASGGAGDDLIAPLHPGLVLHGWQLVEEGGSGNDVIRGADF